METAIPALVTVVMVSKINIAMRLSKYGFEINSRHWKYTESVCLCDLYLTVFVSVIAG